MKEISRSGADIEGIQPIDHQPLNFGVMVRDLRVRSGLTQAELGDRVRRDKFRISALETGTTLPQPTTVAKLIEALKLDPDGVEINALAKQYKLEAVRKKSDRLKPEEKAALDKRLMASESPINYSVLSRELGISRVTVSRRHRALQAEKPDVSPNTKDKKHTETLPSKIKAHRRKGMSIKEIAKKLHIGQARATAVLSSNQEPSEVPAVED